MQFKIKAKKTNVIVTRWSPRPLSRKQFCKSASRSLFLMGNCRGFSLRSRREDSPRRNVERIVGGTSARVDFEFECGKMGFLVPDRRKGESFTMMWKCRKKLPTPLFLLRTMHPGCWPIDECSHGVVQACVSTAPQLVYGRYLFISR